VVVFITGFVRDRIDNLKGKSRRAPAPGYVPLLSNFGDFFTRRFYYRITDCFARVVTSNAGAYMDVLEKKPCEDIDNQIIETGNTRRVMNLGSYNYLGFGDPDEICTPPAKKQLEIYGPSTISPRIEYGTTKAHVELEKTLAAFLGTEDAVCFGMGWATNATNIPSLVGKGDLIISDSQNHNSIITGCRSSGAVIRVFRHNEMDHLEKLLRRYIIEGQPRTHRPWGRILVVVEGIYSMEGSTCPMRELVELKHRYHFEIFLDEAHSIGCMGDSGRGVCDHYHVDIKEIDFMMGTFTKSFGAAGGYIAGTKKVIDWIRLHSFGNVYADSMPATVAEQAKMVLKCLDMEEGRRRLKQLHENSVWFRNELIKRNYDIAGEEGSPVVCILVPPFSMFAVISRRCFEKGVGLVVVSFPAVDILQGRIRICLNSMHSREELQKALDTIDEACKDLPIKRT
jgi:serine palmitoyltransferase